MSMLYFLLEPNELQKFILSPDQIDEVRAGNLSMVNSLIYDAQCVIVRVSGSPASDAAKYNALDSMMKAIGFTFNEIEDIDNVKLQGVMSTFKRYANEYRGKYKPLF